MENHFFPVKVGDFPSSFLPFRLLLRRLLPSLSLPCVTYYYAAHREEEGKFLLLLLFILPHLPPYASFFFFRKRKRRKRCAFGGNGDSPF